jgi:hypothetical protein
VFVHVNDLEAQAFALELFAFLRYVAELGEDEAREGLVFIVLFARQLANLESCFSTRQCRQVHRPTMIRRRAPE